METRAPLPEGHSASSLAHIASSLLEHAVGDSKLHLELTGRQNLYHINPDSLDAMVFAVYGVERRVNKLKADYLQGNVMRLIRLYSGRACFKISIRLALLGKCLAGI